jgi:hypothetical protein
VAFLVAPRGDDPLGRRAKKSKAQHAHRQGHSGGERGYEAVNLGGDKTNTNMY